MYTMEYYAAVKRSNSSFVPARLELETIMLIEISQSVKDKYHMISLVSGI